MSNGLNVVHAAILLALMSVLCLPARAWSKPLLNPPAQDQSRLTAIQKAGLHRDYSILPAIIAVLQHPSPIPKDIGISNQIDPFYTQTALRAAAQLRAVAVLPQIEALIQSKDPEASALARVTKARILAEVAARNINDPRSQAATKINRFLSIIAMTSSEINRDLDNYNKSLLDENGQPTPYSPDTQPIVPLGVYAMREIADMLYQGDYRNYVSQASVAVLNFSADGPSQLKRRFARSVKEDRVAALIEDLSQRDPKGEYDVQENYIMQLALDEGTSAAEIAIRKLQQMETNSQQYPVHGFYNLIALAGNTGGKAEAVQLEKMNDARRQVVIEEHDAAEKILRGRQKQIIVAGY